jgi:hypothetical protein
MYGSFYMIIIQYTEIKYVDWTRILHVKNDDGIY